MSGKSIASCPSGARPNPGPEPARLVGAILRRARVRRGRKQYTVAAQAGLGKAMLSAYELGKRLPNLRSLLRLAAALKLDLGDLQPAIEASAQPIPGRSSQGD